MPKSSKTLLASALAAGILAGTAISHEATAAPFSSLDSAIERDTSGATQVRYRRGYGGVGFVLGLAAGAAIASHGYRSYYYPRYYYPRYHTYYGPVHYRSHKRCWWSHRWGEWVCRRHYW
jgi:hypothetical protein